MKYDSEFLRGLRGSMGSEEEVVGSGGWVVHHFPHIFCSVFLCFSDLKSIKNVLFIRNLLKGAKINGEGSPKKLQT